MGEGRAPSARAEEIPHRRALGVFDLTLTLIGARRTQPLFPILDRGRRVDLHAHVSSPSVRDRNVGERREQLSLPILLYYHGGDWVGGSVDAVAR
jgi:acetyl esterase/lipase